jgi:hypothetical protein
MIVHPYSANLLNLARFAIPDADLSHGIAVERGPGPRDVTTASPGTTKIYGVTTAPCLTGQSTTIAGPHSSVPVQLEVPAAGVIPRGDLLGVGVGGKFVLANGVPAVAEVEIEVPIGETVAEVTLAPNAAALRASFFDTVPVPGGQGGAGATFVVSLPFVPAVMPPLYSVTTAAGVAKTPTVTISIVGQTYEFLSSNPDPLIVGDLVTVQSRE